MLMHGHGPWMTRAFVLALCTLASSVGAQIAPPGEYGSDPELPSPESSFIPTLRIPKNVGWPAGATPAAAAGLHVSALADHLSHPRMLYVLPNADVLVAETDAPDESGFGAMLQGWVLKYEGAPALPSANRITLLRPRSDGAAAERHVFLQGLNSPFGMALIGHDFYVANNDAVLKFQYEDGDTQLRGTGTTIITLPSKPVGHWTRNLLASVDGSKLYVGVGSSSNIADDGIAAEAERAAVWEIDLSTGKHRIFASGLRNPVGLAWEPQTGALWTSVNERDEMGDRLPPDYMTSVREAAGSAKGGLCPQARLRSRRPHRFPRIVLVGLDDASRAFSEWHVRRSARFVESLGAQRLQSDICPVRQRKTARFAGRGADGVSQCPATGARSTGRRRDRSSRRAAGR
jgi:glucose/arabinose dehydrogenase